MKTGAGTLTFSGGHSGLFTVAAGTLRAGADGALGPASDVVLAAAGATLDLNGAAQTVGRLGGVRDSVVNLNGGTLTVTGGTLGDGLGTNFSNASLSAITGEGSLVVAGGTLGLTAGLLDYVGTTRIEEGASLSLSDGQLTSVSGSRLATIGPIVNNGQLIIGPLNSETGTARIDNLITGSGSVTTRRSVPIIFLADNDYTGGTVTSTGSLQLGDGGTTGSIIGPVALGGTLIFNRSDTLRFDGPISGAGNVRQIGTGTVILTRDNSYGGITLVEAGSLYVNGDQSAGPFYTEVMPGATLGGSGIFGGTAVSIAGGTLSPGPAPLLPGTLTFDTMLVLADGDVRLFYNLADLNVGGSRNDLTIVRGNLTLDGTINVLDTGQNLVSGVYRVISYDGALTDNGLTLGAFVADDGVTITRPLAGFTVQTSVPGQVNLVNAAGLSLNYWDAASHNDNRIQGGAGLWQAGAGNDNWTDMGGTINAQWHDSDFGIFTGDGGTVTVDNSLGAVTSWGMQFASDGYRLTGDPLTLENPDPALAAPGVGSFVAIRVGDGSDAGAAVTATIDNDIVGEASLFVADQGTLVLNGSNDFLNMAVIGATVQVSRSASLGSEDGTIVLDGGATLRTTADFTNGRDIVVAAFTGDSSIDTASGTTLVQSGVIAGNPGNPDPGALIKTGGGRLVLTGANTYAGPTDVRAGTLLIEGDQSAATGPTSVAAGATLGGGGRIGGGVAIADGGILAPGQGAGTLTINGGLALSPGAILNYELGAANVAGGPLNDLVVVGGDLLLDGLLNVRVADGGTFGPGLYRLFDYAGTLTDRGLTTGDMPVASGYVVQTAIARQVNLIVGAQTSGGGGGEPAREGGGGPGGEAGLRFWDGDAGPKSDGAVNGGNGIWQGGDSWTDEQGRINGRFADRAFAVFAGEAGTVTVDEQGGDIVAPGMQFASDGYVVKGGAITLAGNGDAVIRVGDGTARGAAFTATLASTLHGAVTLVKADLGTLVLAGSTDHAGATRIAAGTLRAGGGDVFSARSTVTVEGGATLDLAGHSQTIAGLANAGRVDLGDRPGAVLTVAGDYLGNGGTVTFSTVLAGDGAATGRLRILGDSLGRSMVRVVNAGGLGAQTDLGIKLIEILGASDGVFTLLGDFVTASGRPAVVAGGYAYTLDRGDDADWYLRSALVDPEQPGTPAPLLNPGTPLYEGYAPSLLALNTVPTLRQRIGYQSRRSERGHIWGRIDGEISHAAGGITTTQAVRSDSLHAINLGIETALFESAAGSELVAGLTGRHAAGRSAILSPEGSGGIKTSGLGLGVTLTWRGADGLYADAQAQHSWYDTDLVSDTGGAAAIRDNHGRGDVVSLESGWQMAAGGGLRLTPQAQLVYSRVRFTTFDDSFGARVSGGTGDSLRGRIGIALDRETGDAGRSTSHVYVIPEISYEFLDGGRAIVSDAAGGNRLRLANRQDRLRAGLGIGGANGWSGGRVVLFAEADMHASLHDPTGNYTASGRLGLRLKW
nr:autotransporter outer membrane beta-barrel domain-containing protein [Sphingomonas quercus]